MKRSVALVFVMACPYLVFSQYLVKMDYPIIARAPFVRLVNVDGYYNDEDLGWKQYRNATGTLDVFKEYEIRNVTIENESYYMLSKCCSDRQNFFVIEKAEFQKIKISEDEAVCNKLHVKYYGSVDYVDGVTPFEKLEAELMSRIVFHDNLKDALDRFTYNFCINTYYDYALRRVKFYTCLEQKSTVDEYVSLKNCSYRKSYTDIFVSPELFEQRYLSVDQEVFVRFWLFGEN